MKKKIVLRALIGIPFGIAIGYMITIIVSAIAGDGFYHATMPGLTSSTGSQFGAVLVQTLVYCLFGIVFAGSSVIWEIENWSILKQTIIHMVIVSVVFFPLSWLMKWIPENSVGIALYIFIFLLVYIAIWFSSWLSIRHSLKNINRNLKK